MSRVLFGVILACLASQACIASAKERDGDISIHVAEPTEADAVPIVTKLKTKEKIRKKHGEPERAKTLDSSFTPCVERWFYSGDFDAGFGKIKMLLYVDFDAEGKVCKKP